MDKPCHVVTFDFPKILARLTDTKSTDWKEVGGPETRCGLDYYYRDSRDCDAYINVDQSCVTICVNDETLFSGNLAEDGALNDCVVEN
jgi:hypothetical protein